MNNFNAFNIGFFGTFILFLILISFNKFTQSPIINKLFCPA